MAAGEEKRADPDALLASLKDETRGKLTVFLGAAAGVGKTYAMLQAAREHLAEGVDVVIGWAETHGRRETEALLQGVPTIPPRHLDYREKTFAEMDLDTLLARRPELALVDELAHTNVPGSRHARRHQDVEELLSQGMDVFTTLNIQHVESLNDVVARITGVIVRETVPDKILDAAEIKLVDIPPEELLQRLQEGKVYVPDQAREALRKFFRLGNINALRELALRYAAQRVDSELETYMRAHAIPGPWPVGERVMVCISPSPLSAQLIRAAYRMASSLKAEWLAVSVETPRRLAGNAAEKDSLARNLRLAEELGAEIITITGNDVAEELLRIARRRNATQIIIGKPLYSRVWEWLHGSVVDKIIRHSEGINVHVIPGRPQPNQSPRPFRAPQQAPARRVPPFASFAGALGMVLFITFLNYLFKPFLDIVDIALAYLLPILISAIQGGIGPSVAAAVLGILAFDFFFVPPFFSLTVANIHYLLTFTIFVLVALLTGTLAGRLQQHVKNTREREARIATLYALSREIAVVPDLDSALGTGAKKIAETIDGDVAVMLPDESGKLTVPAGASPQGSGFLNENERAVATWVFEHGQIAGRGTDTLGGATGLYVPLRTEGSTVGVLGIRLHHPEGYLQPQERNLLEAFSNLIAVAVNRIKLAEQARQAYLLAESERLWLALFNSLSHELRTPLASIIGGVTGLLEGGELYSSSTRRELLQTIRQEAERMNRLVGNLLDMARLKSGMLQLNKEWSDIQDIIGVAVSRFGEPLSTRPLKIEIEPGLPLVPADFALIEQVLVNLLDNALKYSEPGSEIFISARRKGKEIEVVVADRGQGIPPEELGQVFDKFYRLKTSRQVSGTGLGLTICKDIVEAHGGRIWAENNPGGGTVIIFVLPFGDKTPGKIPAAGGGDGDGGQGSADSGY